MPPAMSATPQAGSGSAPLSPYLPRFCLLSIDGRSHAVDAPDVANASSPPEKVRFDAHLYDGVQLRYPTVAYAIWVDLDAAYIAPCVRLITIGTDGIPWTVQYLTGAQAAPEDSRVSLMEGSRYAYLWSHDSGYIVGEFEALRALCQAASGLSGKESAFDACEKFRTADATLRAKIEGMTTQLGWTRTTCHLGPITIDKFPLELCPIHPYDVDQVVPTEALPDGTKAVAKDAYARAGIFTALLAEQAGMTPAGTTLYPSIHWGTTLKTILGDSRGLSFDTASTYMVLGRRATSMLYMVELIGREVRRRRRNALWSENVTSSIRAVAANAAAGTPIPELQSAMVAAGNAIWAPDSVRVAEDMQAWIFAMAKTAYAVLQANPDSWDYDKWSDAVYAATRTDCATWLGACSCFVDPTDAGPDLATVDSFSLPRSPIAKEWHKTFRQVGVTEFSAYAETAQSYFDQYFTGLDIDGIVLTDKNDETISKWRTYAEKRDGDLMAESNGLAAALAPWFQSGRVTIAALLHEACHGKSASFQVPGSEKTRVEEALKKASGAFTLETNDEVSYNDFRHKVICMQLGVSFWEGIEKDPKRDATDWETLKKYDKYWASTAKRVGWILEWFCETYARGLVLQLARDHMLQSGGLMPSADAFFSKASWVMMQFGKIGAHLGDAGKVADLKAEVAVSFGSEALSPAKFVKVETTLPSGKVSVSFRLAQTADEQATALRTAEEEFAAVAEKVQKDIYGKYLKSVPTFAKTAAQWILIAYYVAKFGEDFKKDGFKAVANLTSNVLSGVANIASSVNVVMALKESQAMRQFGKDFDALGKKIGAAGNAVQALLCVYEAGNIYLNPKSDFNVAADLDDSSVVALQATKGAMYILNAGAYSYAAYLGWALGLSTIGPVGWAILGLSAVTIAIDYKMDDLKTGYYTNKERLLSAFRDEFQPVALKTKSRTVLNVMRLKYSAQTVKFAW